MSHFYLTHPSIRKIKEKKKKRNINNDLVDLPSHDTTSLLSFLVPRNFPIVRNMGRPCCPFRPRLPPSILKPPIFLLQFLPPLPGSSLSPFFLPVSCPSITSNSFPSFSNIPGHIAYLTIHITSSPLLCR